MDAVAPFERLDAPLASKVRQAIWYVPGASTGQSSANQLSRLSGYDCVEGAQGTEPAVNHERARLMATMVGSGCGISVPITSYAV
jgi:hypothetical protein